MSDVLTDLNTTVNEIQRGVRNIFCEPELSQLLIRASQEIEALRALNIEKGWAENPDRMGGQFTQEELNRDGWL